MKLRIVLLVALLLSLGVGAAGAQGPVSYTSGFQVQNLEGTIASIVLDFYDQAGALVASPAYTIDPNSSKTFFPINDVAAGFNGSLVINSSNNVRAINNLVGSGPANYFATTNGFQGGAASVSLPLVMCNNSGFDTWFNVQNAGAADASVTISYTPGSDGTARTEGPVVIKPGAAKTFNQTAGSATMNCTSAGGGLAGPSGKFIGSAVINSTQPVVAAAMQINTTGFKVLMGYGGFTGGSPTVALPLLMANNSNMYTGFQVQNTGTAATNVTVAYSANTVAGSNPANDTFALAPGASKTIIMAGAGPVNNWAAFGRYIGAATITNSASQPLVAVVNQVLPSPALGSAYEGFNPATATANAERAADHVEQLHVLHRYPGAERERHGGERRHRLRPEHGRRLRPGQ